VDDDAINLRFTEAAIADELAPLLIPLKEAPTASEVSSSSSRTSACDLDLATPSPPATYIKSALVLPLCASELPPRRAVTEPELDEDEPPHPSQSNPPSPKLKASAVFSAEKPLVEPTAKSSSTFLDKFRPAEEELRAMSSSPEPADMDELSSEKAIGTRCKLPLLELFVVHADELDAVLLASFVSSVRPSTSSACKE